LGLMFFHPIFIFHLIYFVIYAYEVTLHSQT
jgi:hypothetical protein